MTGQFSTPDRRRTRRIRVAAGWTAVELVVVMAVIVVLLTIAYPSYVNQVQKARRADGHALLYEAAQREQQFFTTNNQFTATVGSGGLGMSATSDEGHYTLTINRPSTTSYTLTATAVGAQASDTSCGNLTLTHLNVKGCTASGCDADRCW
jgi:type IV pilus assembly protein PilE